jgi:hypothetical protein
MAGVGTVMRIRSGRLRRRSEEQRGSDRYQGYGSADAGPFIGDEGAQNWGFAGKMGCYVGNVEAAGIALEIAAGLVALVAFALRSVALREFDSGYEAGANTTHLISLGLVVEERQCPLGAIPRRSGATVSG